MNKNSTSACLSQSKSNAAEQVLNSWFDPIESGVRDRIRELIENMLEAELEEVLARPRYVRRGKASEVDSGSAGSVIGHRHGHRSRKLLGSFGPVEIAVPRARLNTPDGKTREWKSQALRAYQRRTMAADALIAGVYLSGTNTRRVRRALRALFGGAVSKTRSAGSGAR